VTSSQRATLIRHLVRCLQSKGSKTSKGQAGDEGGSAASGDGGRLAGGGRAGAVGGSVSGHHGGLLALVAVGLGLGLSESGGDGGLSGLLSGLNDGLSGRGSLGGSSRGGGLLGGLRAGVLAESLDGGENLVQGSLGTALGDDARGSDTLDGLEVLADAGVVVGSAVSLAGDGIVQARNGALGHVVDGLGVHGGSEGDGNESVLHVDGWGVVVVLGDTRGVGV